MPVRCPHDGHIAYSVYWCDDTRRWLCSYCGRVLCEVEYSKNGYWERRGKGLKIAIPYQKVIKTLPVYKKGYETDAGFDLYSTLQIGIFPHQTICLPTNIRVCIPKGCAGRVEGRSSMAQKGILCHTGTIDSGYTGIISVVLTNLGGSKVMIYEGDRIAQLIIEELPQVELVESDLPKTERGSGGFGSTGR